MLFWIPLAFIVRTKTVKTLKKIFYSVLQNNEGECTTFFWIKKKTL